MAAYEQAGSAHLVGKWDILFKSDLQLNHLAGMFVLDFPDIARHGFGPDLVYRNWFVGLRQHLQQGHLPVTHHRGAFNQPHRNLEW